MPFFGARNACLRTRRSAWRVWGVSVALYGLGGGFAFVLPWLGN